nr:fused MFS/spermidine synthase [Bacteroidota bacterium]
MYKIKLSNENCLTISIIITGSVALMVQIIFLREFLNIFMGNELVMGMILGNWMIVSGAGAYFGTKLFRKTELLDQIIAGLLILAVLPFISVFSLYFFKSIFYPPGVLPGFLRTWLFSFLIMLPFCFTTGWMFTKFVMIFNKCSSTQSAPKVYGLEAAGSVAGGFIFTFLLLEIFSTFQILVVISTVMILAAILLQISFIKKTKWLHLMVIYLLFIVLINMVLDLDNLTKSLVYKDQEILFNQDTPYGNIVITQSGDQFNFFENGISLFSTNNVVANEETVHYSMVQHPDPQNILCISGDLSGLVNEIKKYKPQHIDLIEMNPVLLESIAHYTGLRSSDSISLFHEDPRQFILNTNARYDVVLVNLPSPSTAQINRFYTIEFFENVKSHISPSGVVILSLEGSENYLGEESAHLYGIVFNTLKSCFVNVEVISGQANYFLASNGNITLDIIRQINHLGIENKYVNQYYVNDLLVRQKSVSLKKMIDKDAGINRDFFPIAYFTQIKYWLSWFGMDLKLMLIILTGAILLVLLLISNYNKAIFVAGFTAASVEVMLLIAFQILFGYLFRDMAMLIALFMAGLATGAFLVRGQVFRVTKLKVVANQFFIGLSALLVVLFFMYSNKIQQYTTIQYLLLYALMFTPGLLTGFQYALITMINNSGGTRAAASAYAFDLVGSAGGAIIVAMLLIPAFGLIWSGVFLFVLNVLIAGWLLINRSKPGFR